MWFSLVTMAQWYVPVVFSIPTFLPALAFPFMHADGHSTVAIEVTVQRCLVEQMSSHFGCLKMIHTKCVQRRGSFPNVLIHTCRKNAVFLIKFCFLKKKPPQTPKLFVVSIPFWSFIISDHLLLYSWSDFVHALHFYSALYSFSLCHLFPLILLKSFFHVVCVFHTL